MRAMLMAVVLAGAFALAAAGERDAERYGGIVRIAGKGKLAVVDCRSGVDWEAMAPVFERFDEAFHIDVVRQSAGAFAVESAEAAVARTGANAVLFVGNREDYPMSLTATEQRWAFVNVAPLRAAGGNFTRRCRVLLMRGLYRALGSDTSRAERSCLSPVHSPADLDAISDLDVAMDTYMAIGQSLDALGIVPVEYGTYQEACEIGIAAPPTNDVQRTVWEKVHQIPDKPITIEFDPKRDK